MSFDHSEGQGLRYKDGRHGFPRLWNRGELYGQQFFSSLMLFGTYEHYFAIARIAILSKFHTQRGSVPQRNNDC